MLKKFTANWKKRLVKTRSLLMAKLIKGLTTLLIKTCHIQIEGLEKFCQLVAQEKCLLMLWHNRLVLAPFILSRYTPQILYAALVSGSRDGDILSMIIHSCKNGNTIRVPHLSRYQALRDIVRHVEERKQIVIITPDGPRGPRYEIKPGIAVAALETQAYIVSLDWEAKHYWELKTWDRLRLPKPFTTIRVIFAPPVHFSPSSHFSLEEVKALLKKNLPQDN